MSPKGDEPPELCDAPTYLAIGMSDVPDHDEWMTAAEAERFRGFAFTKRREEARLGRWTAKHAIANVFGLAAEPGVLRELEIRNASDGAPEVFIDDERASVNISMTDRADWAVCMVFGRGTGAIGCDLELVEPRSDRFVADWFTPSERELVDADPARHDEVANLVWSAKESGLKVLRTGLRRDTRSVEVDFGPGGSGAVDGSGGWRALSVATAEGDRFAGWWQRFGDFVLTFAGEAPTEPPRSMLDPSPLHRAIPSHSWLDDPYHG